MRLTTKTPLLYHELWKDESLDLFVIFIYNSFWQSETVDQRKGQETQAEMALETIT